MNSQQKVPSKQKIKKLHKHTIYSTIAMLEV